MSLVISTLLFIAGQLTTGKVDSSGPMTTIAKQVAPCLMLLWLTISFVVLVEAYCLQGQKQEYLSTENGPEKYLKEQGYENIEKVEEDIKKLEESGPVGKYAQKSWNEALKKVKSIKSRHAALKLHVQMELANQKEKEEYV